MYPEKYQRQCLQSVYFNLRNIFPKSGTFPPRHSVYYIYIITSLSLYYRTLYIDKFLKKQHFVTNL